MRIKEIQLQTSVLDELKKFYSENLKLKIIKETPLRFSLLAGSSVLTFMRSVPGTEPYYHFAFNIPENSIYEAIHWLNKKVEPILCEGSPVVDFPNWNAHSFYFYDPAGNIVELIARHNLKNASEAEFNSSSLLSISEIGLPVLSVGDFYSRITEVTGVNLWWGNLDTFAAAGDEEGLFIITTTKRNWFPTDKPCKIFPLKVITDLKGPAVSLENGEYMIINSIEK